MSKLETLLQFLSETPDDPFIHFALAKEYEKLADHDQALARYHLLVDQHPSYVGTYYHLGKLLEQMNQADQALGCYRDGIQVATAAGDQHSRAELEAALDELQTHLG